MSCNFHLIGNTTEGFYRQEYYSHVKSKHCKVENQSKTTTCS